MAEIGIPEEGLAGIHLLIALGAGGIEAFHNALEQTGPTLVSPRERAVLIHEALGAKGQVDDIERILAYTVRPLHTLRAQLETSPSGLHAIVARSAEREPEPKWDPGDLQKWSEFKPQIVALFGSEIAMLEAKAAALLRARPNTIQSIRVFSDVRPVFDDEREEIKVSLITNTLRVRYFNGTESRTIHLSMDPCDLDELDKQVNRARQKNDRLRAQNAKLGVKSLEIVRTDGGEADEDGDQQ